jgi:putative copper resistance protein D
VTSAALSWLRGIQDAALLAFAGVLAFRAFLLPREWRQEVPGLGLLAGASGLVALAAGAAWFAAELAAVAQPASPADWLSALPPFVIGLPFGQLLPARLALILLALLLPWPAVRMVLPLAAVALQPWLGHPAEFGLAVPNILHLLAGSLWAGGLVPLLLCMLALPPPAAARVLRRFSVVGAASVLVLAGTGLGQAWVLAGGVWGLTGSPYGRVALLKAGLFALALALAALNGLALTPALARSPNLAATLRLSVTMEALLALAIVLAAGWLANMQPG